MNLTFSKSKIKTIRQNDPNFIITDQFTVAPRAGFEINRNCPREYKLIIAECINNGWLKPIANLTERELIFTGLSK